MGVLGDQAIDVGQELYCFRYTWTKGYYTTSIRNWIIEVWRDQATDFRKEIKGYSSPFRCRTISSFGYPFPFHFTARSHISGTSFEALFVVLTPSNFWKLSNQDFSLIHIAINFLLIGSYFPLGGLVSDKALISRPRAGNMMHERPRILEGGWTISMNSLNGVWPTMLLF